MTKVHIMVASILLSVSVASANEPTAGNTPTGPGQEVEGFDDRNRNVVENRNLILGRVYSTKDLVVTYNDPDQDGNFERVTFEDPTGGGGGGTGAGGTDTGDVPPTEIIGGAPVGPPTDNYEMIYDENGNIIVKDGNGTPIFTGGPSSN